MGTVYRGEHQETHQQYAVKALAPNFADDDHFRARFESEIKALIKLDHPNIVRLISYGQEGGNLYFAMELVDGQSLFHLQRKGHRFDWREILTIARDVAQGLRHAHDRGIIHRDLKPGNLLRTTDGTNKITDFGIAKSFGASQNTGTNVLGTIDFMSPEQAKGQPVTVRSDLYSLGTVLYTLLAGKPPFQSNSVEESIRNLTKVAAPSISTLVPDVPQEIDSLISKLMHKNPEKRIQTALALLRQLDEVEGLLREYSEAKTAEDISASDTFQVRDPFLKIQTEEKKQGDATEVPGSNRETVEIKLPEKEKDPAKSRDYFNQVTEQQRVRQSGSQPVVDGHVSQGVWPLAISLVLVLIVVAVGLYFALKPPSADQLFEQIQAYRNTPEQVRDEIGQFLSIYPDDERAEEVRQAQGIADAIALHNKLSIRNNMSGMKNRLSELERQYLAIIDQSSGNPPAAYSKMKAFHTLHKDQEGLSEDDQACVTAAANYVVKIKNDAEHQVEFNREWIESALERAAGTPAEAQAIYQSIVQLYDGIPWAADLVSKAKAKLQ